MVAPEEARVEASEVDVLFAALILAVVVGIWSLLDRSWQILLLALAVVLIVLAQNPSIHS